MKEPITYAFIGSSHTLGGVNDELIQGRLRKFDMNVDVANLARIWGGINVDYIYIKDLLSNQRPAVLFIEIRKKTAATGNPIFPIVADYSDIFRPINLLKPGNLIRDLHTAFNCRFDYIMDKLFNTTAKQDQNYFTQYGYLPQNGTFNGEKTVALTLSERLKKHAPALYDMIMPCYNKLNEVYDDYYMRLILDLASDKGIRVVFLYMPGYAPPKLPDKYSKLSDKHRFLIPPLDIFNNVDNFADEDHLNPEGAKALSIWLANMLQSDVSISTPEVATGADVSIVAKGTSSF